MTEKVNVYHKVGTCLIDKKRWWVLCDGSIIILTRPENTVLMSKKHQLYSLLYWKDSGYTMLSGKELRVVGVRDNTVTIVREDRDDNNKKNVTKI